MNFGELMFEAVRNGHSSTAKIQQMSTPKKEAVGERPVLDEKRRRLLEKKEFESMEQRALERKRFVEARRKEKAENERQQRLQSKSKSSTVTASVTMRNADRQSLMAHKRALALFSKQNPSANDPNSSTSISKVKRPPIPERRKKSAETKCPSSVGMDFQALMQLAQSNASRTISDLEADLQKRCRKSAASKLDRKRVTNRPKERVPLNAPKRQCSVAKSSLQIPDESSVRRRGKPTVNQQRLDSMVVLSNSNDIRGQQLIVASKPRLVAAPSELSQKFVPSKQKMIRRRLDSYEEEEDSELDDFIDDSEVADVDASQEIRRLFKYDPSKYRHLDMMDDRSMVASYDDICSEEARSARLGLAEDLEEFRKQRAVGKRISRN